MTKREEVAAQEKTSEFEYLLNAMENAAAQDRPANHDYFGKRQAVLKYVADAKVELAEREQPKLDLDALDKLEDGIADDVAYCRHHNKQDTWLTLTIRRRFEQYLAASELREKELREALRGLMAALESVSEDDDGCLYVNGRSATSLQSPIERARAVLSEG